MVNRITVFVFFYILILTLSCDKPSNIQFTTLTNPTLGEGDCAGFEEIPQIPGWSIDAFTLTGIEHDFWTPYFIDETDGFLFGQKGNLIRTQNGGEAWGNLISDRDFSFHSMQFINDQMGFVSATDSKVEGPDGYGGSLFKTFDGGETWIKSSEFNDFVPVHFFFFNENEGIASMRETFFTNQLLNKFLARTSDGGQSWTPIDAVPASGLGNYKLSMNDDGFGSLTARDGQLYLTTDRGHSWQLINTNLGHNFRAQFFDEMTGYVSDFSKILRTDDGGSTWQDISNLRPHFFHFFNPSEAISFQTISVYDHMDYWDECNAFLTTSDRGETWIQGETSFNFHIGETFFWGDQLGFTTTGYQPQFLMRMEKN